MQTVTIRTTQNVFIEYPVASLSDRILAYFVDTLIIIAYYIGTALFMFGTNTFSIALIIGVLVIPAFLYHLAFEIFMGGQSLGNLRPVLGVTEKIKNNVNIQTDLPPVKFLYTIVKDYGHLTAGV